MIDGLSKRRLTRARKTLETARGIISDPEHWMKRQAWDGGQRYCAIGSIFATLGGCQAGIIDLDDKQTAVFEDSRHLLRASLPRAGGSVPDFNDSVKTTHADVMKLFDKAICEAKEAEKGAPAPV